MLVKFLFAWVNTGTSHGGWLPPTISVSRPTLSVHQAIGGSSARAISMIFALLELKQKNVPGASSANSTQAIGKTT